MLGWSAVRRMAPTLILIRHGQAEHNATGNMKLLDPALTEKGVQQCKGLQNHLQQHEPLSTDIELIVSSPMRRTLQTTVHSLGWLINGGTPVEIDPMWQENSDLPCDTGSDLKVISAEFPDFDFSEVDPTYPDKSPGTPYAYSRSTTLARGQSCLKALHARPEKVIAVVTHSAFLRTAISQRRYENADYRIFTMSKEDSGEICLVEDDVTSQRGGGLGKSAKGIQYIDQYDFRPEDPRGRS